MDDGNSHNSDQVRESFGTKSLYEILGISKTATEDEIKKGYRKQALKMHPDKGGEPKMFQALSVVHSILSDPEKRKLYDETGDIDAEKLSDEFDFWYAYFRNMFPKLTTTAIIEFGNKYIGSQEENDDVMESYHKYNGDFQNIMDSTMCAEEGDEDRICIIINDNIAKGIEKYPKYQKYQDKLRKANNNHKKLTKKRKDIALNDDDSTDLAAMMLANRNNRASTMASIFSKYGGSDDLIDPLSDEAFEKGKNKINKNKIKGKK